jgi:hypothetical protein
MERRDWRAGRLRSRPIRLLALAATAVVALLAGSASASAATYYVTQSGTGTDCTLADPCGSVGDALTAHRVAPQPDDQINVGPGTFVENVEADQLADDGLEIRGAVSGGVLQTTLRGTGSGGAGTGYAVALGLCQQAHVTLRDANVDTVGADSSVGALNLEGHSNLEHVQASNQAGSDAFDVVDICDRGSVIRNSEIDATGTDTAAAVSAIDGFRLAGSVIHLDSASGSGIVRFRLPGSARPVVLTRSWIDNAAGNANPAIVTAGNMQLDSTLISGGESGIQYDDFLGAGGNWQVQNSTIDLGAAGEYDTGLPDILLTTTSGDPPIDVTVGSSILAEEIQTAPASDGPGSVSCAFSDIQLVQIDPPVTDDCDISPGNPQSNTTTDPADQFVGGSPYDWSLKAGAPAIDTGQPGAVPAGFSQTDLAGNPRRAAGTNATCPLGTRDKGAYEFLGPPCELSPPTIIGGANPTPGTQLSSTPGVFNNRPTSFARLWLRCDAAGGNCAAIDPPRTRKGYMVRGSDVGHTLRLQVTASNAAGDSEPALSDPTGVVGD